MTQDTNQTGPYDPQGPERYRYRPQRSQTSADAAADGAEESTHIWAEGIGLGGEDHDGGSTSRPTGYAAASQPTGQASPRQSYAQGSPEQSYGQPQPYPSRAYPEQAYPSQGYPDQTYSRPQPGQGYPDQAYSQPQPGQAQPYGGPSYPGQTSGQTSGQPSGGEAFGRPGSPDSGQSYGQASPSGPYDDDAQQASFLLSRGLGRSTDPTPREASTDGPFAALRDLSFAEPAAPKVTKYLYVLLVVAGVLYWVGAMVSGFSIGGAAGLAATVGGAVALAAWILLVRITLEVALSVIRLGEDTRTIREKLGAADPDSDRASTADATPAPGAAAQDPGDETAQ